MLQQAVIYCNLEAVKRLLDQTPKEYHVLPDNVSLIYVCLYIYTYVDIVSAGYTVVSACFIFILSMVSL